MTKIIFSKDARPLCGEFLEVTEKYSPVAMTNISKSTPLGTIERSKKNLNFLDFRSNITKRFKLSEFQEAIDYGLELFRERHRKAITRTKVKY